VFSVTWHIQRIAQEVRQRAERDDSLTLEDAALRALAAQEIRPEITLEQVLQELRRAAKKKPI
jgi:predicted Ser/Thr protein kinase